MRVRHVQSISLFMLITLYRLQSIARTSNIESLDRVGRDIRAGSCLAEFLRLPFDV